MKRRWLSDLLMVLKMSHTYIFATTDIGIEDLAAKEVSSLLSIDESSVKITTGRIYFKARESDIITLNFYSRTLNKVYILLAREEVKDLSDIYRIAKSIDYTQYINKNQTFAVRAERYGSHSFTSIDIARVVGQAVIDSYLDSQKCRLKVNLEVPDIEIYCMLRNQELVIGINTSGDSLHRRNYRVYNHPAALKTTLAAAMIMLSSWDRKSGFIDPMCGGGTIVIEAALMARNIAPGIYRRQFAFTKLRLFSDIDLNDLKLKIMSMANMNQYPIEGIDISPYHLEGALINAMSAGVDDTIIFKVGDARKLKKYIDFEPRVIVVNPPYGIRMHHRNLQTLYNEFISSVKEIPNVTVVVITAASKEMRQAAFRAGVELVHTRRVLHGKLDSEILVFST